ncbi:MAG: 3-methyl-2-oxobutanoate dehydrogenase subunit VorB [Spirochaetales bacterium]|nr:3-methyl-2-oxobutanoate dehydrogenase subunit VorB [Spirochaetales bacterium]
MANKQLIKGNIALAEGALQAGCRYYFGYPITPQNEICEFMALKMPQSDGVFVQAESEVAAINMVMGAAAAGARVMTTTSSPGFSLMQEGVSYIAAAHLPCVLANVQRGGPGLGNIAPGQADYFQAVKGGGHGDYHLIVLAPASPQEMFDFTFLAFDLADKYRTPVLILSDGIVGQMAENVEIKDSLKPETISKPWALTGARGREANVIRSLWLNETGVEENNFRLQDKYKIIIEKEVRFEEYMTDDADIVFIAYGLSSRITRGIVDKARKQNIRAGMLRPITLYPFPYDKIKDLVSRQCKALFVVEMSAGQMLEDVKLANEGRAPVYFDGTLGGRMPSEEKILPQLKTIKLS